MIGHLETYLINFSFIVIPIFIYQMFWVGRNKSNHKYNKLIITICLGTSMCLCMFAPLRISNGIIYDFRFIPFILSILYGGLNVSIPLYLLMNFCRFLIGGSGFYINLLNSTLVLVILTIFNRRFKSQSVTIKAIIATAAVLIEGLIVIIYAHFVTNLPLFNFSMNSLTYILSQGLAMWIILFFIQAIIENVHYQRTAIFTEKIKAVSELSASISHEVRNPLTVVKGFLQMLDEPQLPVDKRRFYVKVSLTELERAEMIINDYLSMTKPQKQTTVITNLEDDIRYVSNVVKPYSIMHNVNISGNFDNALKVKYDQNQFRQCLLNIMKNCIESMAINGGLLRIDSYSQKNKVIITIKDTGAGMSPEELHRLGMPYYTTKEKGTGLGMTVVFSAIQSMDGNLAIKSEKGQGTTFTITLPAINEEAAVI